MVNCGILFKDQISLQYLAEQTTQGNSARHHYTFQLQQESSKQSGRVKVKGHAMTLYIYNSPKTLPSINLVHLISDF